MATPRTAALRGRRAIIVACAALIWLSAMLGASRYLAGSEGRTRHELTMRVQTRIAAGSEFASLYVRDILERQRVQAATWLAGSRTSDRQMKLAAGAVGAKLAMLLDSGGQILRSEPANPELRHADIELEYPYLAKAGAGRSAVSGMVSSVDGGAPVVAFAVPFSTASGQRVFSVAFAVSQTPLSAYTSHLLTLPGHRVYLIDASGNVVAGGGSTRVGSSLAQHDRPLSIALRRSGGGTYGPHGQHVFASANVAGTPWRIVASEPAKQVFASIGGSGHSLAWTALGGLTLAGLIIIAIGTRLALSRGQLVVLASQLERLARIDALTDISNRRDLEETLEATVSVAGRGQRPLSVLMVDIDHFKRINDTLGHRGGDTVLVATAAVMRKSLRLGDALGRWGGEEFLAILPDTDLIGAEVVAERLRLDVRRCVAAGERPVTITIGVAALNGTDPVDVICRADAALYAGKASGRDLVRLDGGMPAALATIPA
jgi:diguanylate cyclase (GGDEF)-like protein